MSSNERPPQDKPPVPEQEDELTLNEERKLVEQIRAFDQTQRNALVRDLLDPSSEPVSPQAAALIATASNNRWVYFVADLLDLDPTLSKQILKITRKT